MHSALYVADKIALHNDGKILYIAKPNDFMKINDPIIQFLKTTLTQHPCKRYE